MIGIGAEASLASVHLVWGALGVAFALSFIRLVRGPTLPDRVIALDLMSTLAIGLMAVEAIATGQAVFLVAAMVLALIMFLGTAAFALYIQRGARR